WPAGPVATPAAMTLCATPRSSTRSCSIKWPWRTERMRSPADACPITATFRPRKKVRKNCRFSLASSAANSVPYSPARSFMMRDVLSAGATEADMGRTLNLCECLLTMGRDLQAVGRLVDAARVLHRLTGFRDLPVAVAEESHARLATIQIELGEYQQARRHLTSVLFYRPSHAPYYYQLATALHHDPDADASRAARYYRQAVQLDPDQ